PDTALHGLAIVAAAFLLSWAAEAAQVDVSQGLALALIAFIAVLPEYAVDVTFAWKAGRDPQFAPYAVANMTGANRVLVGLAWPLIFDQFLLVQVVAPIASEAPEFLIAGLLAVRGRAGAGLGALISSKVNQWTLLIGALPVAYALAGGHIRPLPLDARQMEELFLTAAQSAFAVALLARLNLTWWGATTLFG